MAHQNDQNPPKPTSHSSLIFKNIKLFYHILISNSLYLAIFALLPSLSSHNLTRHLLGTLKFNLFTLILFTFLLVFVLGLYFWTQPGKVYLVDFACFKPDPARKTSRVTAMERIVNYGTFKEENVEFQRRVFERSGLGDETYLPASVITVPPRPFVAEARMEAEMVMFSAIDEVLRKTGVKPKEIGIVIANCSIFNPTPSLTSMVINHYKLRGNVRSYNLSGMGCSSGLISIDLAKRLLQVHPNSYALVVSTENITLNWYCGNNRSMLLPNCLFRMGSAAILLSNRPSDCTHSKYLLLHAIRTTKAAEDTSYRCVFQQEDIDNYIGVSLSKDLMAVAGESLKANITTLGPLVLPLSEQLLFFLTLIIRKALKIKIKPYVPDFKMAFRHFCIHAGGRAVLDELEKSLELSEWHMEPSRMTLYRFGNTSSSSLWYELAYIEAKGRIRKGDRAWMIGFGSGFKCNSAVWRALRSVDPVDKKNPWMDEINRFPVHVPRVSNVVVPKVGRNLS